MASQIFVSQYPPVDPPADISLAQFIKNYNPDNIHPDKIVHTDAVASKNITYGGLREQAARCAWGLKTRYKLQEGAKLVAILPNSTDFILLAHTVWWAGGIFVPLNPSSRAKDISHAMEIIKPTHLAVEPSHFALAKAAMDECEAKGGSRPVCLSLQCRQDDLPLFPDDVQGQSNVESVPPYDLNGKSAKDVTATICFSSGTTGRVKGVQISHYNAISNTLQARSTLPGIINGSHREVFFLPYCHIYGLSSVAIQSMWVGSYTYGMRSFDLELFRQKLSEIDATVTHLVPPVAALLASSQVTVRYRYTALSIVVVAAAPMKRDLQRRLKARFGTDVAILQGYGLSECSPTVLHQHVSDEEHVGTAGKLLSGTEARLVDPVTLQDVARGEEGEIWIRGPQVMQGYIGDETATHNTFSEDGKWLRTGDILRIDENDNFWVTDRLKELIKYKGFQVAPSELEDLLLQHPDVTDAAVCSIYDDAEATELPLAYVSLRKELLQVGQTQKDILLKDIEEWANKQLAGYKKIRGGVVHLQTLPKTATGKILRKDLPANLEKQRLSKL